MAGKILGFGAVGFVALALSGCALVTRADVSSSGEQGTQGGIVADVSADGRFLVFSSGAPNLVPGDTNGTNGEYDVFVRDLVAGTTERVSIAEDEQEAAVGSSSAAGNDSISADGRYVLFASSAPNLVPGDNNGATDLFVRDRVQGTTELVTVTPGGTSANGTTTDNGSISADGRFVAFSSHATNLLANGNLGNSILLRDRVAGTTVQVNAAEGGDTAISGDGNVIAFWSSYANVVPDDTNGVSDLFVVDLAADTVERADVDSNENQSESAFTSGDVALDFDGSVVAFGSPAADLVPGDTNGMSDVFVRDRSAGTTERVSVATDNTEGDQASGSEQFIGVDYTGRHVLFSSLASTLVSGDTGYLDTFVRDRADHTTTRISGGVIGQQGNGMSYRGAISDDAVVAAYSTFATNIIEPDAAPFFFDAIVRSVAIPTPTALTPGSVARDATQSLTMHGSGFRTGVTVSVSGAGVAVGNVALVDEHTVTFDVTVAPGAALGARTLTVGSPGLGGGAVGAALGFCGGCLTITP